MSPWARFDDDYPNHPKILALGSSERKWTWTEIIHYTCRYSSPIIPENIAAVIPRATPKFINDCIAIGLIDEEGGSREVHDWAEYNPRIDTEAELDQRILDILQRMPDATANEIVRLTGGRRKLVLQRVRQFRPVPNQSSTVPGNHQEPPWPEPPELVTPHATRPVPLKAVTTTTTTLHNAAAGELKELEHAGWTPRQLTAAAADPDRALAWLHHCQAVEPPLRNPAGLAWTKFAAGGWPTPQGEPPLAPGATGSRSTPGPDAKVCPECGIAIRPPTTLADHLELQHAAFAKIPPPAGFVALGARPEPPAPPRKEPA